MTALYKFQKLNPDHRSSEIQAALERGGRFLEAIQRPDGSWWASNKPQALRPHPRVYALVSRPKLYTLSTKP